MKKIFFIILTTVIGNSLFGQFVNRYNGQGDFSDKFNAIATDSAGNIFLCGSTISPYTNSDILVVKLNTNGDTLWTNIYNGPGNGADEATALAIDNFGNAYITGYHRGGATGTDMVTIKYSNAGVIQWIQPYLFGSDESDRGNSIALDSVGNVYVTGQTDIDPSLVNNDDYVTIKYNNAGAQQWLVTKNGIGNGADRPSKIAIDLSGNVVVTGRSYNGADDDYLTVKYDGISGTQLWQQVVDRTNHDRATDLAINVTNGNIYVTGRSRNLTYDYVTVAYDSSGTLLWQTVYDYIDDDRATGIALDSLGDIYVTGQSDFNATTSYNYNITTVKYNSSGVQQWTKTYAGGAGNDDIPKGIFADASGNTYVTGTTDTNPGSLISNDFVILKYNTSGTLQWSNTFSGSSTSDDVPAAISVDKSWNVIVTGYTENIPQRDGATVKYNSSGALQWSKYYNGIGDNSSNSHALAIDFNNNAFVAGYTVEYGTDRNFALQKIDPYGNTQWIRTLNGTSSASPDEAYGVAVDASGNIFVGGYTKNIGVSNDFRVAKYNQLGDTLWTRTYNYSIANESDKAFSLALDGLGNVYLTGKSDNDPSLGTNDDALTVKWNGSGILQWAQRFNGLVNGTDISRVVKVSNTGNVYITGRTFNGANSDCFLLKYNAAGIQQWVSYYDGTGEDDAVALAIDNSENIYLTGFSQDTIGVDTAMLTVKYNAAGTFQWSKKYNGLANGLDLGKSIAIDTLGNIVVCGTTDSDSISSTLNNNMITIKYDPSGNLLWSSSYNNSIFSNDEASEVGVDALNNIYVTGLSDNISGSSLNYDFVTIQYSSAGVMVATYTYNGTGNSKDIPNTLAIKGTDVYITGGSNNNSLQRDMLTLKYKGVSIAGIESTSLLGDNFIVYPNPFNDFTQIGFSETTLQNGEVIKIKISDIEGRIVREISTTNLSPILIYKEDLSPGLYLIQLKSGTNMMK